MKNTLLANGRRIAYSVSGDAGHTVPLVLLHGFCEDASLWFPLLPRLRGIRVVRIDLPGFGGSQPPLTPGMAIYADAVCAVLNELGLDRCVLAGHSMGGYAALEFGRRHPERLAGLGLVHSHPFEDTTERRENRQRGIDMVQSQKKNLYVAQLFPGLFAPVFAQDHPEVVQALIRNGRRQPVAGIVAALKSMMDRTDHTGTLRAIPCPVLFLLGEQDTIVPSRQALTAAALPGVADLHLLPGVGHMGMFEAPERTAEILSDFWSFCTRKYPSAKA